uniref:Alpha-amylase inhibitor like protein n=1 Tax=Phaseolus vulgaris TaxID=3885 RepID=A0A1C9ULV0_PHAVU|nr:alpha-amylase inhibitor like protein [Phaseolus vulgaris]
MHECMMMASSKFFTVLFLVLLSHANSATETSFNIDAFNKTNLILQGDATVTSKGYLRLTDDTEDSMGRAFYSVPIQIRDSTTGNVASFSTNFTFIMDEANSTYGLAFALVPVGSEPKANGPFLGLFRKPGYDPEAHTVAVVFINHWYPNANGRQFGIDVNSILPIESKPWYVGQGKHAVVQITYVSSKKVLTVSLLYPSTGTMYDLYAKKVELEEEVDDWVSVGFSATSGANQWSYETHDVLSWSFSSKFSDDDDTSQRSNILLNNIL